MESGNTGTWEHFPRCVWTGMPPWVDWFHWSCSAAAALVAPARGVLPPQVGQWGLSPEANGEPGWVRRGARAWGVCARMGWGGGASQGCAGAGGLCGEGGGAGPAAPVLGWSKEPPLPVSQLLPLAGEGGRAAPALPRWVLSLFRESSPAAPGWHGGPSRVHRCSPAAGEIPSSSGPEILPRLLLCSVLGIKVSSKALSGSAPGLFIS